MGAPLVYINRRTGRQETETIAGEGWLRLLYENPLGILPLHALIKRKIFSAWMGRRMDAPKSVQRIEPFVQLLGIDMGECERPLSDFTSFNDFFTRRLKKEARPLDAGPKSLASPGDGRLLAYPRLAGNQAFQVKGSPFALEGFLESGDLAREYADGTFLVLRLCPSDYHRVHFPDAGLPGKTRDIPGNYFSVNPMSLKKIARIYCRNRRSITPFESDRFGPLLLIDVGATAVGRICQTFIPNRRAEKGAERGFFAFGGSTTIILAKKGRLKVDDDLSGNTGLGLETLVKMGEKIGVAP